MSEVNLEALDNEINSAIARGEIIGGAFDPRVGRIVPVELSQIELKDEDALAGEDYELYSFKAADGAELALLAHVRPGRHTRAWRLTEGAAKAGYEEIEIPVVGGGSGLIHHWTADGAHRSYSIEAASDGPQAHVAATSGETFMFEAAPDSHLGAWVLSLVTCEFKQPYEEIVQGSTSEEAAGTSL